MKVSDKKNILSAIVFFIASFSVALSQDKLGIANSNYHSVNSIFLNPSSSVDSRVFAQLNLVGMNAYMFTNQMYLPEFRMTRLLSGYNEQPVIVDNKKNKFFYGNFSLEAPALVISHNRFGFGLFARGRAEIDVRRFPYQFTKLILPQGFDTVAPKEEYFNTRNAKVSMMSWAEYGLNLGWMAKSRNCLLVSMGGNLKYLTGINLFYANMNRFDAYMKDTLIDVHNLEGNIRTSKAGWATGNGYGADLGITFRKALKSDTEYEGYYVHSKRSRCNCYDYLYKLGISLLDLGYINFNETTLKGTMSGSTYIPNYNNVSSADSLIQADFDTTIERDVPFKATLPTVLSAQLDMNTTHHTYLNVTLVKSVIHSSFTGVQRANLLSITPRYEIRQVEVAMPFTLHRFIYPQLGFAFRFRTFVLGTDNILPYILEKDTRAVSLYFNLGLSLFRNPACKEKRSKAKKVKTVKRATADCPKFGKRKKFLGIF